MIHSQVTSLVLIVCLCAVSATACGDEPATTAAEPKPTQTEPTQVTPTPANTPPPEASLGSDFGPGVSGFRAKGFASNRLELPESAIPGRTWVDGGTLIIAISDDGKKAFGYSEQHPRWAGQDLEPLPDVKAIPVAGHNTAAVLHGHYCHAYSPSLGNWATLKLPVGETAVPSVGDDSVNVHSASQGDYVFKNAWGKWFSAAEIKAGSVAEHLLAQRNAAPAGQVEDEVAGEGITVFQLKYIQATEALRIVQQLYGLTVKRAAADERTNSLIVRGDPLVFAKIRELLQAIDSPTAKDLALPQPAQSVDDLHKRYHELEQQTQQLAGRLRDPGQSLPAAEELTEDLRDAVRKAFEARQKLQRAELADFAERLATIQQSIEARDRISDRVIDHRVNELLDPNVEWDATESRELAPWFGRQRSPTP